MLNEAYLDEAHRIFRQSVQQFVNQHILPFVDQWEQQKQLPKELYLEAGGAGLLGVGYPDDLGGTDVDVWSKVILIEEMMRAGSAGLVASLFSLDIALPPIVKYAKSDIKQKIVPEILAGQSICALAITEPSGGSDVANLKTRAVKETGEDGKVYYKVNGTKCFITNGSKADYYTVAVRTGEKGYSGISLLLVPRDLKGFSTSKPHDKMGWHASDTADLYFDDVMVPVDYLLGQENEGFKLITSNFQSERLMLSLMANMTAELALDEAVKYVKQRKAFGQYLKDSQLIQHKLADMATLLEASKALTYRCAAQMNEGEVIFKEIAMAKNFATDTADKVTYDAVQLFGGSGFMQGTLVERLYRDCRILSIGGGTREIMNEIIIKQMRLK